MSCLLWPKLSFLSLRSIFTSGRLPHCVSAGGSGLFCLLSSLYLWPAPLSHLKLSYPSLSYVILSYLLSICMAPGHPRTWNMWPGHAKNSFQTTIHIHWGEGWLTILNGRPMGTFFVWSGGFPLTWNTTGWHDDTVLALGLLALKKSSQSIQLRFCVWSLFGLVSCLHECFGVYEVLESSDPSCVTAD